MVKSEVFCDRCGERVKGEHAAVVGHGEFSLLIVTGRRLADVCKPCRNYLINKLKEDHNAERNPD